jgi:hypothetical protein
VPKIITKIKQNNTRLNFELFNFGLIETIKKFRQYRNKKEPVKFNECMKGLE